MTNGTSVMTTPNWNSADGRGTASFDQAPSIDTIHKEFLQISLYYLISLESPDSLYLLITFGKQGECSSLDQSLQIYLVLIGHLESKQSHHPYQ